MPLNSKTEYRQKHVYWISHDRQIKNTYIYISLKITDRKNF